MSPHEDDYDYYQRTGKVRRYTADSRSIPDHVRLTGRSRKRGLPGRNPVAREDEALTKDQLDRVIRSLRNGADPASIMKRYTLTEAEVRELRLKYVEGGA